jgi:hypothetical protein
MIEAAIVDITLLKILECRIIRGHGETTIKGFCDLTCISLLLEGVGKTGYRSL